MKILRLLLVSALAFWPMAGQAVTSGELVDISASHWCYECVVTVIDQHRVMSGYQDHTFRGDWPVERYELAVILGKSARLIQTAEKLNIRKENPQARVVGVSPSHWSFHYLQELVKEYSLLGKMVQDHSFEGEKKVARNEVAYAIGELLQRVEQVSGTRPDKHRDISRKVIDIKKDSYQPYVIASLDQYMTMTPYEDHTFRGEQPVTRYELAAALCRMFEAVQSMRKGSKT